MPRVALPASGQDRRPIAESGTPGDYRKLCPGSTGPTSWLKPQVLARSRNHLVAKLHDPIARLREEWLRVQGVPGGEARADALRITQHAERKRISFVVLGDTGEGDASQMAVVPGLLKVARGTDFTVICSDVVYPAGEARDYEAKLLCPYRDLPGPIYGVPGNHDWYDRLTGFMTHFCGAQQAPEGDVWAGGGVRGRLASVLWRSPGNPEPRDAQPAVQRGPYWSLDAGPVVLVAVDTGIDGAIDEPQGDWLLRVSRERPGTPKILLTGKPPIADAQYRPSPIAGHLHRGRAMTVDDVVRDLRHGYVAVIGGDIHNYQRYPLTLDDGRRIAYIVAGGSGAFTHGTHKIPRIDDERTGVASQVLARAGARVLVSEADSRLFPSRAWSLHWFARRFAHTQPLDGPALSYLDAAALIGDALGLEPVDPKARETLARYRADGLPLHVLAAQTLFFRPLPAPGKLFQRFTSEFLDWNDPPLAKSFLRVDADEERIRLRCYRATGWLQDEVYPPVEEDVSIPVR
jgi:hypothetical protein